MANISINTRLYNTLSPFNVALVVFCSIIVVVGLAGNSSTRTNILLANVAAADGHHLTHVLSNPFSDWPFWYKHFWRK